MKALGHPANRKKLFCFAYAGGSAAIYNKWKAYLDKGIELVPIEYAGRGKRFKEDFYPTVSSALDDIYREVCRHIGKYGFSFFGHSMGCVVAYEICKKLKIEYGREPLHIFVSGRYPPHIEKKGVLLDELPDSLFMNEVYKLGGTPKIIFENDELSKLFVPRLRADYRLAGQYKFDNDIMQFECGISAFHGIRDPIVSRNELDEWKKYTTSKCKVYEFAGGHFFIHDYYKEMTKIINETLSMA